MLFACKMRVWTICSLDAPWQKCYGILYNVLLTCSKCLPNVHDLFDVWLCQFNKNEKSLVTIGIAAIFWTIWKLRNGVVFDNNKLSDPCVPVNMLIKMLHDWLVLQINPSRRRIMMEDVKKVELIAEVFRATLGWKVARRITAGSKMLVYCQKTVSGDLASALASILLPFLLSLV